MSAAQCLEIAIRRNSKTESSVRTLPGEGCPTFTVLSSSLNFRFSSWWCYSEGIVMEGMLEIPPNTNSWILRAPSPGKSDAKRAWEFLLSWPWPNAFLWLSSRGSHACPFPARTTRQELKMWGQVAEWKLKEEVGLSVTWGIKTKGGILYLGNMGVSWCLECKTEEAPSSVSFRHFSPNLRSHSICQNRFC